ncbi:DUF898 family protein [Gaoshiqia sediminis]|uniref:YjgN family protein n=1 Tax=Gaoshiqia sediminis TaxID=2986998 RepID=A0AA41YBH9_9BACT|nr:DUF898 family protein [Gaoshiqia sediminis]MCW0481677.1 YjgN family protein [Gaoshiqia sediminis]
MKNYFNFQLTGKKLFPIWVLFLILFFVPYIGLLVSIKSVESGGKPSLIFLPAMFLLIIVALALTFFLAKYFIEGVAYKEQTIKFSGTFGKYLGTMLLGFFLSIITLGIYGAWFMRDLHRFFVNHSSYQSNSFRFQGKGSQLFVIILLTLMLPTIAISVFVATMMLKSPGNAASVVIIQQLITLVIMVPYTYLVYKWMVNVDYKGMKIAWQTDFWNACGNIALEIVLTMITFGIYMPLAMVRLYKYFSDRTVASSSERILRFGYDADQLNDFLYLWGQILLTIVTLGIYYPWAICNIGSRMLGRTWLLEEVSPATATA